MIASDVGLLQVLSPALAAFLFWFMSHLNRIKSETRIRQLDEAAELLTVHATTIGRLLDEPDLSQELKEVLVAFSDAMADRESVAMLSAWAASRDFDLPPNSTEAANLSIHLQTLQAKRPELAEDFNKAVVTAAAGASLRWPESAALFERVFSKVIAARPRDVTVAMTVVRLQNATPKPAGARSEAFA